MEQFCYVLKRVNFRLSDEYNMLVWDWKGANGVLTTKKAYQTIFDDLVMSHPKRWENHRWKWRIHLKVKFFIWLYLEDKILTWDNFLK